MSGSNTVNISVDDGTNVTSEQMDIDWAGKYYAFTNQVQNYDIDTSGTNERIIFDDTTYIEWEQNSECHKIKKAYVEAADENGKVVYSKKIKIVPFESVYKAEAVSFYSDVMITDVYVKLIDEYGTECKLKCAYTYDEVNSDGFDSTAEAVEATPEVVIRFPNGMKLIN